MKLDMETEVLNAKPGLSIDSKSVDLSLFNLGMPALIENVKKSKGWKMGELYSLILLRSPGKEIVFTALPKGTEIITYQSDQSVSLHVVEGKLKYKSRKETVIISEEQALTISENLNFSVTSLAETIFILTIIKESNDSVDGLRAN